MEIRLTADRKEWDELADRHKCGHRHSFDWNIISAEAASQKFEPLGLYDQGVLVDLFPLLFDGNKHCATSPGCISRNNMRLFINFVRTTYHPSLLQTVNPWPDPHPHLSVTTRYLEMVSDISGHDNLDAYLQPLSFVRKNRARALKNGVSVRNDLRPDIFYRFYLDMTRRNNAREIFSLSWFETILRVMGKQAGLKTAYLNDIPIGAVFFLISPCELYDYFPVIDYNYRTFQAGTLLSVALYEEAFLTGVKRVNLGPDVVGSPTFTFKKHFGAVPTPIYLNQYASTPIQWLHLSLINFVRSRVLASPTLYNALRKVVRI